MGSRRLTKIMVCPDAHHPYADALVWRTFLAAARRMRPDVLVIIGDFADCYAITAHARDPGRTQKFVDELAEVNAAADQVSRLGIKRVIFCEGNHETRISRFVAAKAPELHGMLSAKEAMQADARCWEWVPYKESIRIGEMNFTHDVERCGVNTARQSVQDYGDNIVIGHSHRAGVAYTGTTRGRTHVGLNVGWLGDVKKAADYRHRDMATREWQHGFGWINQTSDGASWAQFVPILNGVCVVDGVRIAGRSRGAR